MRSLRVFLRLLLDVVVEECSRPGLGRQIVGDADGSLLKARGERSRPPSVVVRCLLIINFLGKLENHKNDLREKMQPLYR